VNALDAAGIVDPALRASYLACRRRNATHGRTYYLATALLPPEKRPAVHALYAFARHADDIVDDLDPSLSPARRASSLAAWGERFLAGDSCGDPILPAVHDTVARWRIPLSLFDDFLASMRMDLTVSSYATWDDLMGYVHGSAAVIGLQMLPVLGVQPGCESAAEGYARDLGVAFQLTNFIRDVGEDLRRGRVYLPQEDLERFGVSTADLASGLVDGRVRQLLAFEVARTREIYRSAQHGIRLLHPTSRDCISTALRLYAGILDAVERADYRVLDRRVSVSVPRRLAVALPALARARAARATPRRTSSG